MNRGLGALFFTRLFLYLLALALPMMHPAIVVSYDVPRAVLWFVVLPFEAAVAFFLAPPRLRLRTWFAAAILPLLVAAVYMNGLGLDALSFAGYGAAAFLLTVLVFRYPRKGRHVALAEQFFLAFVYFRMLSFSRSAEDVAAESSGLTQAILVLAVAAFLLHGLVLYFAVYRSRGKKTEGPAGKRRREFAVFAGIAALAVVLLAALLPPDFVKNSLVTNMLQDEIKPQPLPYDIEGRGFPDGGNLRSDRGRRLFGDRGAGKGTNKLEGIPEDQWPGTGQGQGKGQGSDGKQYAVMIVASRKDPVYAGSSYNGRLDPVRGFLPNETDALNELPRMRLLETWRDRESVHDEKRSEEKVFVLSTLSERFLPYRPLAVEPTVLRRDSGPFRYSYRAVSRMSDIGNKDLERLRDLDADERSALKDYLDVPLAKNDFAVFDAHLRGALGGETGYFERIAAILKSFSSFQYNLGFKEDASIPALVQFLTLTKEGDCTEFSNSSAILARMAGIPSRVVTGYLAASGLQTPAHVRGLMMLRQALKVLQDFPLEELFLVTTAHRHSWVEFWLPRFGWIDFETTSFAIPPVGSGDPNNRDVVIPLIQDETTLAPVPSFPWRKVPRWAAFIATSILFSLYVFRYTREINLALRARIPDEEGAGALYRLLLLRLAADGRPVKPPSRTSREYAAFFPGEPLLEAFAATYTELRYRERFSEGEREALHEKLRAEYSGALKRLRKPGLLAALRRAFTLRGIGYRW